MRNIARVAFPLAVVAWCSLLACQQINAQYLHPKITEKKVSIHNAVILHGQD